jgi:hypothetical protein
MDEESHASILHDVVTLLIKVERGQGPSVPPALWIRHRHGRLSPVQAETVVGQGRAVLSAAHYLAVSLREGTLSERDAISELVSTFPGLELRSCRLALAWGRASRSQ